MPRLEYFDFDVLFERVGARYQARVIASPAGEVSAVPFRVPFSEDKLENYLLKFGHSRQVVRRIASPDEQLTREFGQRLFDALFQEQLADCLRSSIDQAQSAGRGLRIRLRFSDSPKLADLPWEYLYDRRGNQFLSLSDQTPIVRYLELPQRVEPLTVTGPLRVLVVISSPNDVVELDVESEWSKVQSALSGLQREARVKVDRLENATLAALQRRLRRESYHVLHFIGHGTWDSRAEDGALAFEDEQGRLRLVDGQDLGVILHDHAFRLAVLNACEGARSGGDDTFAGVAQSLVQRGIPAVIAMQFEISDAAAITFAHALYEALADGYPVDESMAEARKTIFAEGNDIEWATPVLYLRAPNGHIFDIDQAARPVRDLTEPPQPSDGGTRVRPRTAIAVGGGVLAAMAVLLVVLLLMRGGGGGPGNGPSVVDTAVTAAPGTIARVTAPPAFTNPRLALSPRSGRAGSRVDATASGFEAGEIVEFFFQGMLVGKADADSLGVATANFVVPRDFAPFAPHDFPVDAAGQRSVRHATELFTVTA
jgi:CHAT domain-containing protein